MNTEKSFELTEPKGRGGTPSIIFYGTMYGFPPSLRSVENDFFFKIL